MLLTEVGAEFQVRLGCGGGVLCTLYTTAQVSCLACAKYITKPRNFNDEIKLAVSAV